MRQSASTNNLPRSLTMDACRVCGPWAGWDSETAEPPGPL